MSVSEFVFIRHPTPCFVGGGFLLGLISLSSTPRFFPLILLLGTLQVYATITVHSSKAIPRASLLWLAVTVAVWIAHVRPSLNALSTAGLSLLVLFIFSALTSAIALAIVYLDARVATHLRTPWAQITLFPAMWASIWYLVSYMSPIGRLATWSPSIGHDAYRWIVLYTGPIGIDWIVASWAVVIAHAVGVWYMGQGSKEDQQLIVHDLPEPYSSPPPKASKSQNVLILTGFLILLTVPSLVPYDLPISPHSDRTTPLTVGCVLPPALYSKPSESSLEDFIQISKKMTAAQVILWPESAVRFDSPRQKELAFERVQKEVRGPYVGVTFEENIPNDASHGGRKGKRRNGLALIGPSGPVMTYYKRNWVPIAESFSLIPSHDPPSIYTLNLTHPKGTSQTDWNPEWPHYRPITITSSICLDFSSPALFAGLESRPTLILAPGQTWHHDVGLAMWEQAKARAEEIGSNVLWCDGGSGGVSGIAGKGMKEVVQVGDGYWMKTIGVEWPFNKEKTTYARSGEFAALVLTWVLFQGGWLGVVFSVAFKRLKTAQPQLSVGVRGLRDAFMAWKDRRKGDANDQGEREPLL